MVVADTGAVVAPIDRSDRHRRAIRLYEANPPAWLLPWAILPEVDYLVGAHVMATAARVRAEAIATLDLRHFAAVKITGSPKLLPRDLVPYSRE